MLYSEVYRYYEEKALGEFFLVYAVAVFSDAHCISGYCRDLPGRPYCRVYRSWNFGSFARRQLLLLHFLSEADHARACFFWCGICASPKRTSPRDVCPICSDRAQLPSSLEELCVHRPVRGGSPSGCAAALSVSGDDRGRFSQWRRSDESASHPRQSQNTC